MKYKNDTFIDGTARLIVLFPQGNKTVMTQEKTVVGGETIIVGPDGTLKLATKSKITPLGHDKKPLSKRLVYIVHTLLYIISLNIIF